MTVTIIGIGHIGGSMAIDLKENGFAEKVIGVDCCRKSLDMALRRKIIDEDRSMAEGVAEADLVILATPVDVMLDQLPEVLDLVNGQTVMDVGSTKEPLLAKVKDHGNRMHFVATHPMAGKENSGIEAAVPGLFAGKCTVICNAEESDEPALKTAESMYRSMGMHIVRLHAREHDMHAAYISHISHITSFALALTVLEKEKDERQIFELASSGFASTVRLAKSSPDMWVPIFRQNREHILDVLNEHINVLSRFRSLLINKEFDRFHLLLKEANRIRDILE